jgi:hypothetical protein
MEARRLALRLDRSTFIRFVLEDRLGILKRPLLDEADDRSSGVQYNLTPAMAISPIDTELLVALDMGRYGKTGEKSGGFLRG